MKKILALAFALCMLLSVLTGCGAVQKEQSSSSEPDSSAETPVSEDTDIDWPGNKTVTIVCPYGAGGGNDTTARFIAKYLPKYIDGTFVVTNISGGSGTVGTQSVLDAAADGYTIMFNDNNTDMLYVSGMTDYTVDIWEDFAIPATADASSVNVSEWDTFEEMVEWAQAHPGELTFGVEVGSYTEQVACALFEEFDIDGKVVDVGSTSDQITALAGNQVKVIAAPIGNVADYRATGQFKTVAMVLKERHPNFPEIPTFIELGAGDWCYMPRYFYMAFKEGTDRAIIDKFFAALEQVVADPDFIADMESLELTPNFMYGEEAQEYYQASHETWLNFNECVQNYYAS